jgi:[acyl-carrier-protein] S-malonyltransferase
MSTDLAFLFPGQGSQYVGMGADLPTAAEVFDRADRLLGFALSRLCLEGPAEALDDTVNTQPAILAVSVAALEALRERLGPPRWVAGHSLGEFSALVAAGALTFEDALHLVRERGRLMKEAGQRSPGGMAAVIGLERETVGRICAQISEQSSAHVGIANDNCPGQIVISGDEGALQAALAALSAAGCAAGRPPGGEHRRPFAADGRGRRRVPQGAGRRRHPPAPGDFCGQRHRRPAERR